MTWTRLAPLSSIPANGAKSFGAVTVFRDGETCHATGSRCPHMGYPMDKGLVRDGVVTCAWHQWEFDLASGGCWRGACDDLPVYPIRISDGQVEVQMPTPSHDRARWERRLADAMLDADLYQQAKAVAALLEDGASCREVARTAAEQGFDHSVGAHRSPQAVVELRSIVAAARLAERFAGRDRIPVLLQGVRAAGGGAGERPVVSAPPSELPAGRRSALLGRYVAEPSPLAIERLLLAWPATEEPELRAQLLELASSPRLSTGPEAFINVVDLLDACDWLGGEYLRHRPALAAWVLGAGRGEPEGEERLAIDWLERHHQRLRGAGGGTGAGPNVEEAQRALTGGGIEAAFTTLLGWLEAGAAPTAVLDALSVLCARRLDHLRPNNGGLWRTATAGVHLCHAARRSIAVAGAHHVHVLFVAAWQIWSARWLHPGTPWKGDAPADRSWSRYAEAFAGTDLNEARRQAVACAEPERDGALAGLLEPLLREDLDVDQLATIVACLGEAARLGEWQHLVAAPIAYVLENRARQQVQAAARFGRSLGGAHAAVDGA
jgi:nitrite reductase/ring-hydroxylating ferredoxin subunit